MGGLEIPREAKVIEIVDVKELSPLVTKSIRIRHARTSEVEPDVSVIEVLLGDFDYAVRLAAWEFRAWHHLKDSEPSKAAYSGMTLVNISERRQAINDLERAGDAEFENWVDNWVEPASCDTPLPSVEKGAPYSFGDWELHPGYKPPTGQQAIYAERVAVWQLEEHKKALANPDNVLTAEVAKWDGPSDKHIIVKVVMIKQEPYDKDRWHPDNNTGAGGNVLPTSSFTVEQLCGAAGYGTGPRRHGHA